MPISADHAEAVGVDVDGRLEVSLVVQACVVLLAMRVSTASVRRSARRVHLARQSTPGGAGPCLFSVQRPRGDGPAVE